jgi:hypothetical protein
VKRRPRGGGTGPNALSTGTRLAGARRPGRTRLEPWAGEDGCLESSVRLASGGELRHSHGGRPRRTFRLPDAGWSLARQVPLPQTATDRPGTWAHPANRRSASPAAQWEPRQRTRFGWDRRNRRSFVVGERLAPLATGPSRRLTLGPFQTKIWCSYFGTGTGRGLGNWRMIDVVVER